MNARGWVLGSVGVGLVGAGAAAAVWLATRDAAQPAADAARTSPFSLTRPLEGRAALTEAQLPDFAAEIEQLINGAAERVIARGSGEAAQPGALAVVAGRRVRDGEPLERYFDVTAEGQSGTVQALGLAFTRPWPARYDMSMLLTGFAHAATLTADGAVLYNFIREDRTSPAVNHGLFRARLTLSGTFTGDVDLHGEIAAGKIVSLVVLAGSSRTRFVFGGRDPRPFVSYVSTVAGTGKAGNEDGAALQAQFDEPAGVLVDRTGRVFIADTGNKAVRELSPNGDVSTLSTAFDEPWDLGFDGLGLLVVSDRAPSTKDNRGPISRVLTGGVLRGTVIRTIGQGQLSPNGFPLCNGYSCDGRTPIAHMQYAGGIDAHGGMVTVAQWELPVGLRMVTPDGTALTLRAWPYGTNACTDGTPGGPLDVARGPRGDVYYTGSCHAVGVLRSDGTLEALAGTPQMSLGFADGRGPAARFSYPAGLVFDGDYLYLTESSGSRVRRVDPATGETLRVAGCLAHTEGFTCGNDFGFRDGPGDAALFTNPQNLALDPWGDLYVADTDNHAIRLVRIANDPERRPVVERVQPLALRQGSTATLTLGGRDLGLASTVDFGAGITAEVVERSAKSVKVRVSVAESAATGPRAPDVATAFGRAAVRDGIALNVIGDRASRAQVRTIAGTGAWSLGVNDIVPAEQAQFAFPGGIAAIDKERLLVADPLEQRVRLITTKDGAARELLEIAVYEAGGTTGLAILEGIEGLESVADKVLGVFGAGNSASAPREALLEAIGEGLDAICEAAGSDCEYMALPWAGLAAAPGNSGGFRLNARMFLPTDVAVVGDGQFLIADTGNRRIKTVGIDFSGTEPTDAPYQVANTDELRDYPLATAAMADDTAVAATSTDSTLAKVTLRDGSSVLSAFAGVRGAFRCKRADGDVRQPLGVPMGIATGKSGTFIADPYCATIWTLDANGEAHDIRGALKLPLNPLPACSDGPLVFATFGAPMDVAVQSDGSIWVVDSWCHSVRVIRDRLAGVEDAAAELGKWAAGIAGWFDADDLGALTAPHGDTKLGAFDPARYWVTTVAGSPDGEAGFKDGAASESLFNAPVSIAIAEDDDGAYVFVSDVGNKRIRVIDLNARAETTTRVPPADEVPPFELPGPNDAPLAPLDALNYLIAWVYHGKAAQVAADATEAILALDDRYLAEGNDPNGAWELSLQIKNVRPDIGLGSPPGFTSASREGFAAAAPLVGTWRAGFSADLIGKARVGDFFSWSPEVLHFGLGVRDLRLTADVDLDPTRTAPQLESAQVHVQALIYGVGALEFNRPVDLRASPRDGALELRGTLRQERVDLGDLSASLDADLVLTIQPSSKTIPVAAGPDDEPWVDEQIPSTRITVAIDGTLATDLQGVGAVSVPLSAQYDVSMPMPDALDVALRALERPIPRIWGEGDAPEVFEIDTEMTRSPAEFARVAAEVEAAFRRGHAPLGVVMSRVRPPSLAEQIPQTELPQAVQTQQPDRSVPAQLRAQAEQLPVPPPAWHGEEDSAIWSAHYLAAAAYRYATEPNADARAGVELALGGIEAMFDVTDGAIAVAGDSRAPVRSRGILSRTLFATSAEFERLDFADGPLTDRDCYYMKPEGGWQRAAVADSTASAAVFATAAEALGETRERAGSAGGATSSVAAAGALVEAALRPVGNVRYGWGCSSDHPVSRDQYIGVMMGLTVANRLVDDARIKARTERLLLLATDFLVENEWNVYLPPEERIQTDFLGNFDKQLTILRIGKTLNPDKYAVLYDYVARASELAWLQAWVGAFDIRSQYYKFNLLQSGLVAVLLLEDDPALRANYLATMDLAWSAVGHHRNAYFALLRVLVRDSEAERAALLDMDSPYDPKNALPLREEIGAVLGEWVARREDDGVRSPEGLLFNRVPDVGFITELWPVGVGEYIQSDGKSRVLALKAMPVHKRPSRESMDFIWQRQPFEVAMDNKIDRTDAPSAAEILEKGGRDEMWREGPGVDYLIAYWLARYLDVVPQP